MRREEVIGRNEATWRAVNERISEVAQGLDEQSGDSRHVYEFYCECGRPGCTERLRLTRAEYEAVRADGTRFVIVPEHEIRDVERVVERGERFAVAEKFGLAGAVASATDPRS